MDELINKIIIHHRKIIHYLPIYKVQANYKNTSVVSIRLFTGKSNIQNSSRKQVMLFTKHSSTCGKTALGALLPSSGGMLLKTPCVCLTCLNIRVKGKRAFACCFYAFMQKLQHYIAASKHKNRQVVQIRVYLYECIRSRKPKMLYSDLETMAVFRTSQANLSEAIETAKCPCDQKTQGHFQNTRHTRSIQAIRDNKPSPSICDDSSQTH